MPGHTRDQELEEELDFHQYKPNVIFLGKLKSYRKKYFDSVYLCNFAAKFSNYDENAFVFEPQLQLTVL